MLLLYIIYFFNDFFLFSYIRPLRVDMGIFLSSFFIYMFDLRLRKSSFLIDL